MYIKLAASDREAILEKLVQTMRFSKMKGLREMHHVNLLYKLEQTKSKYVQTRGYTLINTAKPLSVGQD